MVVHITDNNNKYLNVAQKSFDWTANRLIVGRPL